MLHVAYPEPIVRVQYFPFDCFVVPKVYPLYPSLQRLVESIALDGIREPLLVVADDCGQVVILNGVRRYTAASRLIQCPRHPEWTMGSLLPVHVAHP